MFAFDGAAKQALSGDGQASSVTLQTRLALKVDWSVVS
jgi:hypothetical protein